MATNLSDNVAALARQIAVDQIAQDIDMNGKIAAKADVTSFNALQQEVTTQAGQIAANASAIQAAQTNIENQIISICNEISGG